MWRDQYISSLSVGVSKAFPASQQLWAIKKQEKNKQMFLKKEIGSFVPFISISVTSS